MHDVGPFDGPRDFTYIRPAGRRLSEYEAVTLFVQPLEPGFDPPVAKRIGWPADTTEARSMNWYAFRDPAQMWQRKYIRRQAEQERAIERTTESAVVSGLLRDMSAEWAREAITNLYIPCAYFEHGLFRALAHASGLALSDVLGLALMFNGVDKERHAQDIVFHHFDLGRAGLPVGDDDGHDAWVRAAEFQGLRRLAEHVIATPDWVEVSVATNLVIEPLLGRFLFNEVLWKRAPAHDDPVTPIILAEAENDRVRNIAWTSALVRMLVNDDRHDRHNLQLIESWVSTWYAEVLDTLLGLGNQARALGVSVEEALEAVERSWRAVLEDTQLLAPEEVAL